MSEQENPLDEIRRSDDKSGLGSALSEFVERFAETDRQLKIVVFDMVEDKGREHAEYIKSWDGSRIPEYEEIARCGPGKYKVMLNYTPKGKQKQTSTSVIVKISNKYKNPDDPPAGTALLPVPQTDPLAADSPLMLFAQMQQGFQTQMLTVMQQFMAAITDISMTKAKAQSSDMMGTQRMIGDIMMTNIEQQQALVERILGSKYGVDFGGQESDADDEPLTFFSFVKDLFARYGDQLLNAGPIMQKMFRDQFQKSEDAGMIEENPELYIAAYQDIITENPENKGKLDKILDILGAPNPEQLVPARPGSAPVDDPEELAQSMGGN